MKEYSQSLIVMEIQIKTIRNQGDGSICKWLAVEA